MYWSRILWFSNVIQIFLWESLVREKRKKKKKIFLWESPNKLNAAKIKLTWCCDLLTNEKNLSQDKNPTSF